MKLRVACVVVGFLSLALSLAAQTASSASASAQVPPPLIQFSNVATDEGGSTLSGVVSITFSLYTAQQGGEPLWTETQNNVQLDSTGHYSVELGITKSNGIPTAIFTSGAALWLGAQIAEQAEQPRVLLVSVPYALKAADAETLGGRPASAYALAGAPDEPAGPSGQAEPGAALAGRGAVAQPASNCDVTSNGLAAANTVALFTSPCNVESSAITQNSTGNVGIGATASSTGKLYVFNSATNFGTAWLQRNYFNTTASTTGTNYALAMDMNLTGMTIPAGVTDNGYRAALIGRAYPQTTGFAGTLAQEYGVYGFAGIDRAESGAKVGTATAGEFQIFNNQPGTTITNAYGVYISNSGTGGIITNRYDLYASSLSANNYFAGAVGIGTTTPTAALEVNALEVFSDAGVNAPLAGILAFGGNAVSMFQPAGVGGAFFGATGPANGAGGGNGLNASGGGGGEFGGPSGVGGSFSGGSGLGGGDGLNASGGGADALGASGGTGGTFLGGAGILNLSPPGTDGDGIDATNVDGGTITSSGAYAGNFTGDINVSGAVFAGTKDFRIDHLLDPANKYLVHASVESSEMMNLYSGNVTTDSQGHASVQLPEWFEVLNTDFRYQLTVIGQFAQAIVGRKIENDRFEIRTSAPNVEVSWQVTGVRQDAYARAHPLVVEQEKDARLRGFYIHPELYGAPPEKQIEWARHPQMMKRIKEMQARQLDASHQQVVPRN
jgi:trimeric autotransporter adhesin